MKTIKKMYLIHAGPDHVFELLTDPGKIEKWSGSPAEMDLKTESHFSLWGGSIHGINRKLTRTQIIQDWKENKWENFSQVTMNLKAEDHGTLTRLELIHENIPDGSAESINQGWDEYYFGPLIELAESKN